MADFNLLDPATWPGAAERPQPQSKPQASFGAPIINGVEDNSLAVPYFPGTGPKPGAVDSQKLMADMAQIDEAIRNPTVFALSEERGNGFTANNQILNDYKTVPAQEFIVKYGADTFDKMAALGIESRQFLTTTDPQRDLGETVGDAAVGIAGGFNQGVIGAVTGAVQLGMGPGPLKDAALDFTSGLSKAAGQNTENLLSEPLKRRTYIDAVRASLDSMDNEAALQTDLVDSKNYIERLSGYGRYILQDSLGKGRRLLEDPTMLGKITAEGVGSLLPGGGIAKVVGAATRLAPVVPGVAATVTPQAAKLIEDSATKAAFAPTIGAMEGGGASNQAQQAVMEMSDSDLAKTPEFQRLLNEGLSPEAARLRMAATAASIAFLPASITGAVTGKLVEKIELAPLAKTDFGGLLVNAGKEALEEGTQSAVGELSSNAGVKFSGANPEQNLAEGVGSAAVEGVAGGVTTTAALQGPRLAAKGAVGGTVLAAKGTAAATLAAVSGAVKVAGIAVKPLVQKGEAVKAAQAAASPVSPENMAPAVQQMAATAPAVAEGLRTLATEAGATDASVGDYISRVEQAYELSDQAFKDAPDVLVDQIEAVVAEQGEAPNSFQVLDMAAGLAGTPDRDQAERVAAATYVLKSIAANQKLFGEDLPAFLEKIPVGRPEFQAFNGYVSLLTAIEQTPSVKEALDWARTEMQQPDTVDATNPKVVAQTVDLATLAPQAMNAKVADQILNQGGNDPNTLTPAQRRIVQAGKVFKEASQVAAEQLEEDSVTLVNRQIEKGSKTRDKTKAHQMSLVEHVTGIAQAISAGDRKTAQARANSLGMFARSMRNKVVAFNKAIAAGDRKDVAYQSLGREGWLPEDQYFSVYFNPGTEASERLARTVHAEATLLATVANEYARQFGTPEVEIPALAPMPAKKEAQSAQAQNDKRGSSTTATEATTPARATTTGTDVTSEQSELPPQTSQPAQEPETAPVASRQDDATQEVSPAVVEPVIETQPEVATETKADETTETTPEATETLPDLVFELDEFEAPKPAAEMALPELYPDLVQPKGRNFFHEAFQRLRRKTSRLLGVDKPLETLLQALSTSDTLREFLEGKDIKYTVDAEKAGSVKELLDLGQLVRAEMRKRLVETLKTPRKDAKGKAQSSYLEMLQAGEELNGWGRFRALNIMEKTPTSYRYNQALVETAIVAGLDWVMNVNTRTTPPTKRDVAGMLDIEIDAVTDDQVKAFQDGISMDSAARSLAQNIVKFWGVAANKDTPENYVQGIPEAIAKEILYGLEAAGLIELGIRDKALKFAGVSAKEFNRVWFDRVRVDENGRPTKIGELTRSLNGVSNLLADMVLVDREPEGYQVGAPITVVDKTQLHNPLVPLSAQQTKALTNTQATPHYPNMPMFDFINSLGLEAFVEYFSGRPYKAGDLKKTHKQMGLNKVHWESIKGLQRSLVASFENVQKQMADVRSHAETSFDPRDPNSRKTSVEKTPTYYRAHVNKLGRIQMGGLSTPQADKLAREIFMATKAVLDLSNQQGADFAKFLMTVGQGIGLKTEKVTRSAIGQEVMARTMADDGALRPLVLAAKSWLANRNQDQGSAIPAELRELLQTTKPKLSMHGLHSIISVARYELARDSGQDLSKFETMSYLEADGKTNGPINALMLYTTGAITPLWIETVAKGGAFFGRLGKTLNAHMGVDDIDLYQAGADKTDARVATLGREIQESSPKTHELFMSFRKILAALNVDVTQDAETGEITIKRGLTKNPLTITIYGSGEGGIAGNIAGDLLEALYEALSGEPEAIKAITEIYPNGSPEFMADLAELTSKVARKNKKEEWYTLGQTVAMEGSAIDFELNEEQRKNLITNVQTFLVEPMRKAIDETVTSHVKAVTDATQQATQIQSIILKAMFIDKVTQRIAMKQADPEAFNYKKGDFLSQNEMDDILKSLLPYSPVINTGTQAYFLSGGEKADLFPTTTINIGSETYTVSFPRNYSVSLTDDMSTPAFAYGPTLSGVKAIPTMVVGSGDGQMVLNFLAENVEGSANRVVQVFDGVNMPPDMMDRYSTLVNQSVFKTWTTDGNPVTAAYESFAAFMALNPIKVMFGTGSLNAQQEQARLELSQTIQETLQVKAEEMTNSADATLYAENLLQKLKDLADDTEARRRTYAEFPFSVDQMASAESPFVNTGFIQLAPDASYADIADAMEQRRRHHLAEIRNEKRIPPVTEAIGNLGVTDELGAKVVSADQIPALLKNMNSQLSPTQREMLRNAGKLLNGSGYRMVFGTTDQLDAWEQANNADRFVPGSNSQMGKIDPVSKIILISNMEAETVIHELVHAATIDKVRAFYSNPSSLAPEERAAVERIEGLMFEWLALDPGKENAGGQDARQRAEAEIYRRMPNRKPTAEAVNEFMAWVLGNQDLAVLAQKTKVKNPAWRIIGDALAALKTLIWGTPNKGPRVGDSILSNLRFNTRVLIAGPTAVELLQQDSAAVAMYQSKSFGSNDRLSEIRKRLNSRITAWLEGDGTPTSKASRPTRQTEDNTAKNLTAQLTGQFAFHFSDLKTMQAASTFAAVQRALMTGIELNSNALSRMEDLYSHVVDQLKYTDFMVDPDKVPADPNDEKQAIDKLDLILGKFSTVTDKFGRSSLLSSFLALAMTSDQFRSVLARLEKPKADKSAETGLDGLVENAANNVLNWTSLMIAGERNKDTNVRDALDRLMAAMIENVGDQRVFIERYGENGVDKIEGYIANQVQEKSAIVAEKSADIVRTTKNRVVKAGASAANVIATAINEQLAGEAALGLISNLNKVKGWEPLRAVVNDLVGRTRENAPIFDLISKVRSMVQQLRQQFRDELPVKLARTFKKPLSKETWTAMYRSLGKTDLAALTGSLGLDGALEMITDDARRANEIKKLEASIESQDKFYADIIIAKSKQLAHYMMTGEAGVKLMSNAEAIGRLLGHQGANHVQTTPQLIAEIDRLVSLYAIEETSAADRASIADLMQEESEGVEFVTSYLMGQRKDEMTKAQSTDQARYNHIKGNIPSEALSKGLMVIASDSEYATLIGRGYTRVGAYAGSATDRTLGKRSYYYAPVTGRAIFSQGVLQTVHQTASGVDPETGFMVGEVTAGRITDPQLIKQMSRMLDNEGPVKENLRPVFDDVGRTIAYERLPDPAMLERLDRSTNLADMIGAWRGRQIEEIAAQQVNKEIVQNLHDIWVEGKKKGREKEFVNIAKLDPKTDDPILIEAARLIPAQALQDIRALFGPDTLMVRRDMLLDTFGARQASVGDLFTGETRWKPGVTKKFEALATGIFGTFGANAYTTLVGSEQNVQDIVAGVKQMIVVRSVIVPAANMVSNMFQLLNRGIPIRSIIHGMGAKTAEINSYVKRRHREIDLEAELRAAEGKNDTGAALRISNQIQSIQDSYRRMSIWPLIEAGEFSAISSGQVTAEDLALSDGKWATFIEKKVNALPEPFRTPIRYGLITRDTALFQGLARAVQYGDFVAKAVLYDDLVGRKKINSKEAVATVNEAFVNYNRLAGRSRQYLESVGLLWFYNYKLRIMKEAAHMLRHNPLRSLLMTAVPGFPLIGDIGGPVSDNILAIGADGKLGFSIGPGMGFGSWQLNPWINLAR